MFFFVFIRPQPRSTRSDTLFPHPPLFRSRGARMTVTSPPGATSPVAPCPACGAWSLPALAERSALLDVCDVLVLKALDSLGRKIIRQPRSRFKEFGGRPWHVAHTQWRPDVKDVDRTLDSAWDVLPALLTTDRKSTRLNSRH